MDRGAFGSRGAVALSALPTFTSTPPAFGLIYAAPRCSAHQARMSSRRLRGESRFPVMGTLQREYVSQRSRQRQPPPPDADLPTHAIMASPPEASDPVNIWVCASPNSAFYRRDFTMTQNYWLFVKSCG